MDTNRIKNKKQVGKCVRVKIEINKKRKIRKKKIKPNIDIMTFKALFYLHLHRKYYY